MIVLDPQPSLEIEHLEGYPVVPRTETTEYMHEYYAPAPVGAGNDRSNYDDLGLGVTYWETERAQT